MIYSYALTSSQPVLGTAISINTGDGTIYVPRLYTQEKRSMANQANDSEASRAEFNQLRYVCRQMCQETRGLSLRHNDIVVKYEGSTTARELCIRFLGSIASTHHRRIQRVEIIEAAGGENAWNTFDISASRWYAIGKLLTGGEYPAIHTFCRANSKTAKVFLRCEVPSQILGQKGRLEGLQLTIIRAALRMVSRGESAVEMGVYDDLFRSVILAGKAGIEDGMWPGASDSDSGDGGVGIRSPPALSEYLRVTVSRAWVGPVAEVARPVGFYGMLGVPVREWIQTAKREFEEGC